jgi:stage II sporulation protein D
LRADSPVAATIHFLAVSAAPTTDIAVRVRLAESAHPTAIEFSVVRGSFAVSTSGDTRPAILPAHFSLVAESAASGINVDLPGGAARLRSLRLTPVDSTSRFELTVTRGSATLTRRYDGALEIRPSGEADGALLLVNHVPLESYVAAVVTSEYGLDDIEGTRAMAILARTYAIRTLGEPGTDYDHVDHELSQVYRGVDGLSDRAVAAAQATRGQVVLFRGELAEAVYHAESGGHTAANDAVWAGTAVGYLRGVADPYANNSPYARWEYRGGRTRVLNALSNAVGQRASGFVIDDRSADGRVSLVRILTDDGTVVISGNEFRLAVIRGLGASSLKSTLFEVSLRGDAYVFTGSGFGHGVGLSQWGAHEMARRGYSSDEIIAFYLRGTEVAKLDLTHLDPGGLEPLPAIGGWADAADSAETGPPFEERAAGRPSHGRIGW